MYPGRRILLTFRRLTVHQIWRMFKWNELWFPGRVAKKSRFTSEFLSSSGVKSGFGHKNGYFDIAWSYFIDKIMRIWYLNSMSNTEGRNYSLERQRSKTTFTQESAVATVKCGFLWKTSFHTGRTSSKSRYFVLTRSSLDHFRNNQTVVINFFQFLSLFFEVNVLLDSYVPVWVNSKTAHASPPENIRAFDLLEKFCSNSPVCWQFRWSNAPLASASKSVKSPTYWRLFKNSPLRQTIYSKYVNILLNTT